MGEENSFKLHVAVNPERNVQMRYISPDFIFFSQTKEKYLVRYTDFIKSGIKKVRHFLFSLFEVLGIKSEAMYTVGKSSATKLYIYIMLEN